MAVRPIYNRNFFDVIDTEEKAYFLGILYSDGCILPKEHKIQLHMCDLDVLEKFKKALDHPGNILYPKRYSETRKQSYKFQVFGKEMVKALVGHGCTPRKSNTLEAPKTVPSELIRHFIRGYFDGDGCISLHTRSRGTKEVSVSVAGTKSVMSFIRDNLIINDIKCGVPTKHKFGEVAHYFDIYKNSVIDFAQYLYNNSSVWMDRKYDKFVNLASETHGGY